MARQLHSIGSRVGAERFCMARIPENRAPGATAPLAIGAYTLIKGQEISAYALIVAFAGKGVSMDPRTRMLLEAPVGPTIVKLALPNVVVMVAQASVGLIETYFIGKLGIDALAGMAL